MYVRLSVCLVSRDSHWESRRNVLWYISHKNGFSPVWITECSALWIRTECPYHLASTQCMESNSVLAEQKSATMPRSKLEPPIHDSVAMNIAIVSSCMLKEDLKYSLIFGKYT